MPKVLACPVCGNKHPLDLLVGLETFACSECGKKLAVPEQALVLSKPKVIATESVPSSDATNPEPIKDVGAVDLDNEDIVVVARASIDPTIATSEQSKSADEIKVVANARSSKLSTQPVVQQGESRSETSVVPSGAAKHEKLTPKKHKHGVTHFALPLIGQIISWGIAIPVGFFIVVIVPRFFGYGFHASDFVGVITHQGLGRYKIVVALVALWSIATVVCLELSTAVVKRLFRARKRAV